MKDMKFLVSSLVSRRFQITLTKDLRKGLDVVEGDKVFYKQGDEVIIRKA